MLLRLVRLVSLLALALADLDEDDDELDQLAVLSSCFACLAAGGAWCVGGQLCVPDVRGGCKHPNDHIGSVGRFKTCKDEANARAATVNARKAAKSEPKPKPTRHRRSTSKSPEANPTPANFRQKEHWFAAAERVFTRRHERLAKTKFEEEKRKARTVEDKKARAEKEEAEKKETQKASQSEIKVDPSEVAKSQRPKRRGTETKGQSRFYACEVYQNSHRLYEERKFEEAYLQLVNSANLTSVPDEAAAAVSRDVLADLHYLAGHTLAMHLAEWKSPVVEIQAGGREVVPTLSHAASALELAEWHFDQVVAVAAKDADAWFMLGNTIRLQLKEGAAEQGQEHGQRHGQERQEGQEARRAKAIAKAQRALEAAIRFDASAGGEKAAREALAALQSCRAGSGAGSDAARTAKTKSSASAKASGERSARTDETVTENQGTQGGKQAKRSRQMARTHTKGGGGKDKESNSTRRRKNAKKGGGKERERGGGSGSGGKGRQQQSVMDKAQSKQPREQERSLDDIRREMAERRQRLEQELAALKKMEEEVVELEELAEEEEEAKAKA